MITRESWYVEADERDLARLRKDALTGDRNALLRYWNTMERMGFPAAGVDAEILKATPMEMWGRIPLILIAQHRHQVGAHMGKWDWVMGRSPEEIAALPTDLQPQIKTLVVWVDPEGESGLLDDVQTIDYTLPIESLFEGGEIPYASEDSLSHLDDWRPAEFVQQHGQAEPYEKVLEDVRWAVGPGEYQVSPDFSQRVVQLYTIAGYEFYYWYFIEMPKLLWDDMVPND